MHRVDHLGRGTYDRTIQGLRMLQAGLSGGVGAICVLDPNHDPDDIFQHLVDHLGLVHLSFVLPMYDHDSMPPGLDQKMAAHVSRLFSLWRPRRDQIRIRFFSLLLALVSDAGNLPRQYKNLRAGSALLTISSDGDLGPNDDVRNTFPQLFSSGANVHDNALLSYLNSATVRNYTAAAAERHDDCVRCRWSDVCDGGDLIGSEAFRYSHDNGFRNPSIYCHTIQTLLSITAELAIQEHPTMNVT